MLILLPFLVCGIIVGVTVTAFSAMLVAPTGRSAAINVVLGVFGVFVGFAVWLVRGLENALAGGVIVAVVATGAHEALRWLRRPRSTGT